MCYIVICKQCRACACVIHVSDIDDCESKPCMNDGTCTDGLNKYTCKCSTGYMGVNCESMSDQHSVVSDSNTISNYIDRIGVITLYDIVIKLYLKRVII